MPAPTTTGPSTLYDKLFDSHLVDQTDTGECLIYIDRHIVHEVTSPQAFESLRSSNRKVRRPDCTLTTVDHNIPTSSRGNFKSIQTFIREKDSLTQVATLEQNVVDFGLIYYGMTDKRQGIVHVIGPEQGFTLPGTTVVCGDSHTSTNGAFGAMAFGIGTSEVEHVLATQTLLQSKAKNMKVQVDGELPEGCTSKDIILHIIGKIGTAGGTGCALEYCGSTIRALSIESRMSMCNMSVEAGARCGMVAPDEITFEYVKGRPLAPKSGKQWDDAVAYWKTLRSDEGAHWDIEVYIDAKDIAPTVSWGTSPQDVVAVTGSVPDPDKESNHSKATGMRRSLKYMGLEPNTAMQDVIVDKVFIGSCTNSRIEDMRSAAKIAYGRHVAQGVYAMVVPGSGLVKEQAEAEGLDRVFKDAGFDWREAGCSMCLGMNEDKLKPEERCASTSNRNFEGRQGPRGRTHLMSPAMAAAAAVTGKIADVRKLVAESVDNANKLEFEATDSKSYLDGDMDLHLDVAKPDYTKDTKAGVNADSLSDDLRDRSNQASQPIPKGDGMGMESFTVFSGPAVALAHSGSGEMMTNVDTDMIIEARHLKTVKRTGLGVHLFGKLRYDEQGNERKDFILNQAQNVKILLAWENFGCGSSREHAPWALKDYGIRCVIAHSFGDIFYNNCFKNGMLPLRLSFDEITKLRTEVETNKTPITVDLAAQRVTCGDLSFSFEVDEFRKHCLLEGLDEVGLTMKKDDKISSYESFRSSKFPWLDGVISGKPTKIGEESGSGNANPSKVEW